jgi:hypothetical protein
MRDSQVRFIRQLGFPGTQFPDSFYSALMFQPRAVAVVVALGVLFQSSWLFLALSAVLWWSTLFPSLHLFDAIYNYLVAYPRGLQPLGIAPAPRRFAQGLAGTVAMVIGVALFAQVMTVAWIFEGLFVVASTAVVFRDACAGAEVYYVLRRVPRPSVARLASTASEPSSSDTRQPQSAPSSREMAERLSS